jgi:hypothetical protein
MICSVTSEKLPGHEAYLARTVMPLATTLYNIGMINLKETTRTRIIECAMIIFVNMFFVCL